MSIDSHIRYHTVSANDQIESALVGLVNLFVTVPLSISVRILLGGLGPGKRKGLQAARECRGDSLRR